MDSYTSDLLFSIKERLKDSTREIRINNILLAIQNGLYNSEETKLMKELLLSNLNYNNTKKVFNKTR